MLRKLSQSRSSMTFQGIKKNLQTFYIFICTYTHNPLKISFNEKWACQQFWRDRWEHNSNLPRFLNCIFIYKNQEHKAYSSQHLSDVSELKHAKQNRQSKMSSCHTDLALMIQTCYQKRLSDNRRFLLSHLSQCKTLSKSDSALRKGQLWVGSRSKPLAPSLPTMSRRICHQPANPVLQDWVSDKVQMVSDVVLQAQDM